jgi:hypothetical protein
LAAARSEPKGIFRKIARIHGQNVIGSVHRLNKSDREGLINVDPECVALKAAECSSNLYLPATYWRTE